MASTMTIVDTKSDASFRVRVNRSGRRTFSRDYKLEIVEECLVPGASVAAIALSHRINANQVRKWIVQHRAGRLCAKHNGGAPTMLPVTLQATSRPAPSTRIESAGRENHCAPGVIEVELDVARIRVRGAVDASALRTVLELLAKR
jgi:transposase-like protein